MDCYRKRDMRKTKKDKGRKDSGMCENHNNK